MKKILFADQFNSMGGGQIVLSRLIHLAKGNSYEPHYIGPVGGELGKSIDSNVASTIPINFPPFHNQKKGLSDILSILKLTLILIKERSRLGQFNLIYINAPRWAIPFGIISLLPFIDCPNMVLHIHSKHTKLEKKIFQILSLLPRFQAFVFPSSFLSQYYQIGKKSTIVANALSFAESKNSYQDRPFKKNAIVVGRISTNKGQAIVCEVAKKLPDWNFYFVGDSDFETQEYKNQLTQTAPLNCHFLGKLSPWDHILDEKKISVSIVPSIVEEGFGLSAIESVSKSLITYTTKVGALADLVENGITNPFLNEQDLATKLTELNQLNEVDRSTLLQARLRRVRETYSSEQFEKKILIIFKFLI